MKLERKLILRRGPPAEQANPQERTPDSHIGNPSFAGVSPTEWAMLHTSKELLMRRLALRGGLACGASRFCCSLLEA